jgi:hypothetical protein
VPVPEQPPEVDQVDDGQDGVHPDHRPDADREVEADQDEAADQVQQAQSQDAGLQQ